MALTLANQQDTARQFINQIFVQAQVTANLSSADILAAVQALDNDLDATLNAAVTAYGGTTTILNAFIASLPAPFSTNATNAQKAWALAYVLLKRAGAI